MGSAAQHTRRSNVSEAAMSNQKRDAVTAMSGTGAQR